jgi:hypothetical protein
MVVLWVAALSLAASWLSMGGVGSDMAGTLVCKHTWLTNSSLSDHLMRIYFTKIFHKYIRHIATSLEVAKGNLFLFGVLLPLKYARP